jgi:hypothetical protein
MPTTELVIQETVTRVVEVGADQYDLIIADAPDTVLEIAEPAPILLNIADSGIDLLTVEEPPFPLVFEVSREEELPDYTKLIDEVPGSPLVTYVGEALPGAGTSEAVWRIRRITETAGAGDDVAVEWADDGSGPNAKLDKVFDDRATYAYG